MEMGLLMFPSPTGSANMARMVEGLGFKSLVFADTQCLTPEVLESAHARGIRDGAHRDRDGRDELGEP